MNGGNWSETQHSSLTSYCIIGINDFMTLFPLRAASYYLVGFLDALYLHSLYLDLFDESSSVSSFES